jgi:hypothetical protein
MWAEHARARCIEFEPTAALQRFVGEHDGYQRLADPVIHRREIELDPHGRLIEVADSLRCEGEHLARRAWHFAENCQVEVQGNTIRVVSGFTQVNFESGENLERVEVHRGGSPAQGGWISRRFGHKQPTTTVLWYSRISGSTMLRTRIGYTRSRPSVV